MARRIVGVFTLLAFVVFSVSCLVYKVKQEDANSIAKKGPKAKIVGVQTKWRDYFEFPSDRPATISGGILIGESLRTVEFRQENILHQKPVSPKKAGEIATTDGKRYRVLTARPEGNNLVCEAYLPVSIPVSEIQLAWAKSLNAGATVLQTVGCVVFSVIVLALWIISDSFDIEETAEAANTLPTAYVDFLENYFIDAELHWLRAGQGLTMTEWQAAACVPAAEGKTKVLLSNELNEPKSIDELKIFVVDHPPGTKVIPDILGIMHTVSSPFAPKKASDRNGRDILPLLVESDKCFWMNSAEEKNPKKREDLRDELILEFPKPEGVEEGKLLVNATNTAWASDFASSFLLVPGTGSFEQLPRASGPDLSGGRARDWYRGEEFYSLRVWLETKNGWESKQMIYGGGPFVPRDMIYALDIGDVPGSTLKIKLMPPAGFWMIDRLAMDYSKDSASDPVECTAEEAVASSLPGEDVLSALAQTDGECLVLPKRGDTAEITFTAPPLAQGKERSIILETVCLYKVPPDLGETSR